MDGEVTGTDRVPPAHGCRSTAAGGLVLAWSISAIAFGLLNLVAVRYVDIEQQGGYCESIDHPGPCENLLPWFLFALAAIGGGAGSFVAGIGFLRRRPRSRHRLIVALATWSAVLLALGALATAVRPGLGVALLVVALINAGVCLLAAVLGRERAT